MIDCISAERKQEVERIKQQFPNKIPVISNPASLFLNDLILKMYR